MTEHTREFPSSLRQSMRDGTAYSLMVGLGETYFAAFGIFLQATAAEIGLLAALPAFLGAIAQVFSLKRMQGTVSRRLMVAQGSWLHAGTLLLIASLALLPPAGIDRGLLLILGASLYFIAVGTTLPAWTSLIGDLVPVQGRARFFALRTRRNGIFSFIGILLAGQILDASKTLGHNAYGFLLIFTLACCARAYSAYCIGKHEDPPQQIAAEHHFTFTAFLRRARHSNFTRFVFYFSSVNFGVAFAGPYFAVYMLRDLQLSYIAFMAVTTSATVAQFLTMRHWARLSEMFGNKAILNLCGFAVGIVPVLWLFSSSVWYLMCIQAFSGFVWAGFNLAAFNYMFDAVTPPKRARCAAYQAIVNGFFVLIGSIIGGFVISTLPNSFRLISSGVTIHSSLPYVFLVSGIIRLLASGWWLPKFSEVKDVPQATHTQVILRIMHLQGESGSLLSFASNGKSRRTKRAMTTFI